MTWEFADVLGRRLIAWGVLSGLAGMLAALVGDAWWRGAGVVLAGWGAIDALVGGIARSIAERRRRATIGDDGTRARDAARIRGVLLASASLDLAFVAAGAWLAFSAGDAWRAGAGAGIAAQGAFLLLFDLAHAAWVPAPAPLLPPEAVVLAGHGHDAFRLSRERAGADAPMPARGALLVHGLAGSPREMRGLAAVLAADGWLVEVPRLPGHGPQLPDIAEYRVEDWVAVVEDGAASLREAGVAELLVVGHSVGASLALATARRIRPDRLVLLAPFAWSVPPWQRLVAPVLRVLLPPGFRLFSRLDLSDPATRAGVAALLPGLDLDDPAAAARLREVRVPLSLLEQLFRVSAMAASAAAGVDVPVLAVQGLTDTVSRPARTRALLARLPRPVSLLELPAGHDLASEDSPVRDAVLARVRRFAAATAAQPATADDRG